jgi:hemoglobin
MPPNKTPHVTEESIKQLVDSFYEKVRSDPQLGPVFARQIAADQWPAHLAKMYAFWSAIMLKTGRYRGNPLLKHAAIPHLEAQMFKRWLALFGETAEEIFAPDLAADFRSKAERIAASLSTGLSRHQTAAGLHSYKGSPLAIGGYGPP